MNPLLPAQGKGLSWLKSQALGPACMWVLVRAHGNRVSLPPTQGRPLFVLCGTSAASPTPLPQRAPPGKTEVPLPEPLG